MASPCRSPGNVPDGVQVQGFKFPIDFFMDADFESGLTSLEEFGSYIMYHGTTLEAAKQIKHYGLRRSVCGLLGPGVYVSRSIDKARCYPLRPRPGERLAILKLKVQVGKLKRIDRLGHPLQRTWQEHGFDTAWVPPNCGIMPSGLEEDCIWDPRRIEVLDIWKVERNGSSCQII